MEIHIIDGDVRSLPKPFLVSNLAQEIASGNFWQGICLTNRAAFLLISAKLCQWQGIFQIFGDALSACFQVDS